MITDKSNSGTLTTDGRSGGESTSGHDGNETLEPKHSSANSSRSNDDCNNDDIDNINDSSGIGESKKYPAHYN